MTAYDVQLGQVRTTSSSTGKARFERTRDQLFMEGAMHSTPPMATWQTTSERVASTMSHCPRSSYTSHAYLDPRIRMFERHWFHSCPSDQLAPATETSSTIYPSSPPRHTGLRRSNKSSKGGVTSPVPNDRVSCTPNFDETWINAAPIEIERTTLFSAEASVPSVADVGRCRGLGVRVSRMSALA